MGTIVKKLDEYYSTHYEIEWKNLESLKEKAFHPIAFLVAIAFSIALCHAINMHVFFRVMLGLVLGISGYLVLVFSLTDLYDYWVIHYFGKIPFERMDYTMKVGNKVYKNIDVLYIHRSRVYFEIKKSNGRRELSSIPLRKFRYGNDTSRAYIPDISSIYWYVS